MPIPDANIFQYRDSTSNARLRPRRPISSTPHVYQECCDEHWNPPPIISKPCTLATLIGHCPTISVARVGRRRGKLSQGFQAVRITRRVTMIA